MHWWQLLFAAVFWTLYAVRRWKRKNAPQEPVDGSAGFSSVRNPGGF